MTTAKARPARLPRTGPRPRTSAGRATAHLQHRSDDFAMPTRLLQFLLARIADEEVANALSVRRARNTPSTGEPAGGESFRDGSEARRKVIGDLQHELLRCTQPSQAAERDAALARLLALAAPYEHHLSFRPEWRIEPDAATA